MAPRSGHSKTAPAAVLHGSMSVSYTHLDVYKRQDVAYAYTGTVPTGASALPEKATVKYGAPVTVAEAATGPVYTFSGWRDVYKRQSCACSKTSREIF